MNGTTSVGFWDSVPKRDYTEWSRCLVDKSNGTASIFVCEARCDFSTAADGACDELTDAVGKSRLILRDGLGEAIFIEDGKLIHGRLPVVRAASPVCNDVAQGQPDQLGDRLIAGEVAAVRGRLSCLTITNVTP